MRTYLIIFIVLSALVAPDAFAQPAPTLDSLVVNPIIPSHNYITEGEYHNFKAYATSNSGGSLTCYWTVNRTTKSTSWEEIYTAGSPPGGGGGGLREGSQQSVLLSI